MFEKIGLLPLPSARPRWMHSNAYIPNAVLRADGAIRIVAGFWDEEGISRPGYMDVPAANPVTLQGFSETPSMQLGAPGAFDDHGVSPLCIVAHEKKLRMYYAGWQLNEKVRYLLFTGLAESADEGKTFTRVQRGPVLGPSKEESIIRAGSFVYPWEGKWGMLYAGGAGTIEIDGKQVPNYALKFLSSPDGIHWPAEGAVVFAPDAASGEFGFGRPFVMQDREGWKMWYGIRHKERGYEMGYAESADGVAWERRDEAMQAFNNDNWTHDRQMRAFPSLLSAGGTTWMFYDGDHYGKEGVCVARLKR